MRLLDGIKTVIRELTVNENVDILDNKEIQRDVQEIIKQQTRNLEKLAANVSNDKTIPRKEQDFVEKKTVDEKIADQIAKEKAQRTKKVNKEKKIGD